MGLVKVLLIMQELERIGCHNTAKAIWSYYQLYKEEQDGFKRKEETSERETNDREEESTRSENRWSSYHPKFKRWKDF